MYDCAKTFVYKVIDRKSKIKHLPTRRLIPASLKGYYIIPAFPDYAITKSGIIMRIEDYKSISTMVNPRDNIKYALLRNSVGNKILCNVARLLIHTFTDLDKDIAYSLRDNDPNNVYLYNIRTENIDINKHFIEVRQGSLTSSRGRLRNEMEQRSSE